MGHEAIEQLDKVVRSLVHEAKLKFASSLLSLGPRLELFLCAAVDVGWRNSKVLH
jgi:hypothetical protein